MMAELLSSDIIFHVISNLHVSYENVMPERNRDCFHKVVKNPIMFTNGTFIT